MNKEEKEAIEYLQNQDNSLNWNYGTLQAILQVLNYIDKLQKENEALKEKLHEKNSIIIELNNLIAENIDNGISKDELKNILRRVQDYQLNYKDTTLFNIIMQELFGETDWTNLEDKENKYE